VTTNTNAKRPPADGTLTKKQYTKALTDAGRDPEPVWSGEHGVTVRGPHHRPRTDKDDMVVGVRSYYRITFEEPIGSGKRVFREKRTLTLAKKEGRRIDHDLGVGLSSNQAPRRFETVDTLIDEYLKPSNHLDSWNSPRTPTGPTTFLDVWARPVIGQLACIAWDSVGSERILEQMAKCQLSLSYRSQAYTYLTALATFARMRKHGFLPPYADPLAEVTRPNKDDERYVDPDTLPTPAQIEAFAVNLGDVAATKWLARIKNPSPTRLERVEYERFRWSMLPRIMFGGGPRPNECLALRTSDFDLRDRAKGLGLRIERQAIRASSTRTGPPKHGSARTTYVTDEMWDDVVKLVRWTEALFGPDVLVWPRMRDHTTMVDDSTLHKSYFDPAAELTDGFISERVLQWAVEEEDVTDAKGNTTLELVTVPLRGDDGQQKTKKVWNWNWRHLRHLYGTTALAPKATGGWGQDIGDVSAWMGHKSPQTTWEYYIGRRQGDGARMAAGSARTPAAPQAAPSVPMPSTPPAAVARGVRGHLRSVS